MTWTLTPYVIVNGLTGLVTGLMAWLAWQRRDVPGSTVLMWLMVAVCEWSVGAACELAVVEIPAKIFWSKVEYIGTTTAPLLFFLFAAAYNRLERWIDRRHVALLLTVPAITTGLAWTNEHHHWIWTHFTLSPAGSNLLVYGHGPAFWLGAVAYSYIMVGLGTLMLLWATRRYTTLYRRQTLSILAGSLVPWAASFVYLSGASPWPGLDLTPISFAISGTLLAVGTFRWHFFDLAPVARDAVFDTMQDGVLVLDDTDRVIDLNPAAVRLLPAAARAPAQPAAVLFAAWPGWLQQLNTTPSLETELSTPQDEHLELRISPLRDWRQRPSGRLIVLRDITSRKRAEAAAQQANILLQAQLAEIHALQVDLQEQAIRDPLTNLFNRRYMTETLQRELARAARENHTLSLVLLDIDHFKRFNDTYGHQAGDEMLRALGQLLRTETRLSDVACRYGGEEFVVILPGLPAMGALRRAAQWRVLFAALDTTFAGQTLQATLSGGVAGYPEQGRTPDELLQAADAALYAAKAAGRNQIQLAMPPAAPPAQVDAV